jgi:hypothetical protein
MPCARLISLLVIAPWWNTVPPGAAFDLLVLLALIPGWRQEVMARLGL